MSRRRERVNAWTKRDEKKNSSFLERTQVKVEGREKDVDWRKMNFIATLRHGSHACEFVETNSSSYCDRRFISEHHAGNERAIES